MTQTPESIGVSFRFDKDGGFLAKAVTVAGVLIEYAYPTSIHAERARKNPAKVAEDMVRHADELLPYYQTRAWWPERSARMAELFNTAHR